MASQRLHLAGSLPHRHPRPQDILHPRTAGGGAGENSGEWMGYQLDKAPVSMPLVSFPRGTPVPLARLGSWDPR